MSEIAIRVANLSKLYRIGETRENYKTLRDTLAGIVAAPLRRLQLAGKPRSRVDQTIWALRDVSFEVGRGEVVGIIGRNGAGKSTLLKLLCRITEPTEGRAEIFGRVGSLLEVGTGFHGELTGRENIFLNGAILGMRRAELGAKFDEIVAFAEIERFIDTAVKHYSSGMYLRLAFAVAAFLEPEILLIDEVLAVGDVLFQKKCLGKMEDVARGGRTVLFVSHNMGAVRSLCRTGLVLNEGKLSEAGDIGRCIESYFRLIGTFQGSGENGAGAAPTSCGFGKASIRGSQDSSVEQSEPFSAETTLRVSQEIAGFHLFCIVEDMHGRMIFLLKQENQALGLSSVPKGDYTISVSLPPLWLTPGLYALHFKAAFWGGYGNARHVSDRIPLDVTGRHGKPDALLTPAATWNVTRLTSQ